MAVRTCVIFNPTAKGEKAKRFRRHLDAIGARSVLKQTACAGDARKLAAEAVAEGFETIVAAGGDGTVNEVLNGLGDAPGGFERARLGILPLGTVNVFARELAVPINLETAWETLRRGRETRIDLPSVEYRAVQSPKSTVQSPQSAVHGPEPKEGGLESRGEGPRAIMQNAEGNRVQRRYFAQLAGAGLDARAIELVKWELKKKIGPLAYVWAGLQALIASPAIIQAAGAGQAATGGLVLIGNGRLYGGPFRVFPKADLRDGLLEVCVFPRVNWLTLARCGPQLLLWRNLPASATQVFRAESLTLTSPAPVPLEVDGELIGHLPARFCVERSRLRVIVP